MLLILIKNVTLQTIIMSKILKTIVNINIINAIFSIKKLNIFLININLLVYNLAAETHVDRSQIIQIIL